MLVEGECVAVPMACGSGTHVEVGVCVPDPQPSRRFEIRAPARIKADGTTPIRVRVLGTNNDGTPVTDQVVLNTDRPGAGSFASAAIVLDELGGATTFVPCTSTTPGCLGPLELTLALASAPLTPVAHVSVELAETAEVGSIEHCPPGQNMFHVEGAGHVYDGSLTVTDGAWTAVGGLRRVHLEVSPAAGNQPGPWAFEFSTVPIGMNMQVGVYENARASSWTPGFAIMGVTGHIPATNICTIVGAFEVHELTTSMIAVQRAAISFEQWCENMPLMRLYGCVRYEGLP
jgi:hypothetical protein